VIDNNFYYDPNGAVFLDDNLDWQEWTLAQWKAQTFRDLHSFDKDPKLDATYHLLASSPCINTGVTLSMVPRDIDGHLRLDGANDVGADEYGSVSAVQGTLPTTDFNLRILGNPVAEQLVVEAVSEKNIEFQAQILRLEGRLVYSQVLNIAAGKSMYSWDVSAMASGVYVLKLGSRSWFFVKD
jgi:hypothetical protein